MDFSQNHGFWPKITVFGPQNDPILDLVLRVLGGTFPRCPVLVEVWSVLKMDPKIVHPRVQKWVYF